MKSQYLGLIPLAKALNLQSTVAQAVLAGDEGTVLGFESEPTITLGVRGGPQDLLWPSEVYQQRAFEILRLDRGGQATLHNPGQLVIFPVCKMRRFGARAWVSLLLRTTKGLAAELGQTLLCHEGFPGLYSEEGKVVSIGVRLKSGISTHGLAINVHNDLSAFAGIRACGRAEAALDHLRCEQSLEEIFAAWVRRFEAEVDKTANLAEFKDPFDVRL